MPSSLKKTVKKTVKKAVKKAVKKSKGKARAAGKSALKKGGAQKKLAKPSAKKSKPKSKSKSKVKVKGAPKKSAGAPKPSKKSSPKTKASKPPAKRSPFKEKEYVVYPSHGVGQVSVVHQQEIAGMTLDVIVVDFFEERMRLSVPLDKVDSVGMRKIADESGIRSAFRVLRGRVKVRRTMWSRRATEYEAKINSGDLRAVAEVVRDLYRSQYQPERSYSERQLYEQALERMAREVAATRASDIERASTQIEDTLARVADKKALAAQSAEE